MTGDVGARPAPEMVAVAREWAAQRVQQWDRGDQIEAWAWRLAQELREIAGYSALVQAECRFCGATPDDDEPLCLNGGEHHHLWEMTS